MQSKNQSTMQNKVYLMARIFFKKKTKYIISDISESTKGKKTFKQSLFEMILQYCMPRI